MALYVVVDDVSLTSGTTVVPPGLVGRVSAAKRTPGGTPTAGRGNGQGRVGSTTHNRAGSFMAISGQKPWPSTGSFVAAYGQFFMAADTVPRQPTDRL